MNTKYYNNLDEMVKYFIKNPAWIAGFSSGEGSFTAYVYFDQANTWGIQIGLDFSISQHKNDRLMLEAINKFFDSTGGVYDRQSELSSLAFRNVKVLKENIIPYFSEHPLVGSKHLEFERWCKLAYICMLIKNT